MHDIRRRQALAWSASLLAPTLTAMTNDILAATPAAPIELSSTIPSARLLGSGVMRFFGLRVYEARLWAPSGFEPANYARQPFALELIYDRKLEGEAIAERSVAEMRRVGSFSEPQARQWLLMMKKAFPDVAAQDRLLGLTDGAGDVSFFHNGRETARIQDAEYARLFFGIWLSDQTSDPGLRAALLGKG